VLSCRGGGGIELVIREREREGELVMENIMGD